MEGSFVKPDALLDVDDGSIGYLETWVCRRTGVGDAS